MERHRERVARAAAVAALTVGMVTEAAAEQMPFGFCHWAARPGDLVADNGPEYVATRFRDHLAELGLVHHRIPPRSPNHNAVCERFQGTALQEC
jgi:transposase InsO family protein